MYLNLTKPKTSVPEVNMILHLSSKWISRWASRTALTSFDVAIDSTSEREYEPLQLYKYEYTLYTYIIYDKLVYEYVQYTLSM